MQVLAVVGVLFLSYLIGSIPVGLVIVRLKTGKDIRRIESGRTGGTNVMRAAGTWAGVTTAILDLIKGALTVWLARYLLPGNVWVEVLSPVMAVLGHNYSIFLAERDERGYLRLRGGAGGATTVGGAIGLWAPSILIILPIGLLFLLGLGYASIATMSVALGSMLLFAYRAWVGASPWQYILHGLLTLIILIWALRPNICRLINGTERVVGLRAWRKKRRAGRIEATRTLDHSSSSS